MAKATATATAPQATATAPQATATAPQPALYKYATGYSKAPTVAVAAPYNFALANTPLFVGVAPKGSASVMGVLYAMLAGMPKGSTGGALLAKAQAHNWANHPRSKYARPGVVCGQWLAGYINGLVRLKHASTTAQ